MMQYGQQPNNEYWWQTSASPISSGGGPTQQPPGPQYLGPPSQQGGAPYLGPPQQQGAPYLGPPQQQTPPNSLQTASPISGSTMGTASPLPQESQPIAPNRYLGPPQQAGGREMMPPQAQTDPRAASLANRGAAGFGNPPPGMWHGPNGPQAFNKPGDVAPVSSKFAPQQMPPQQQSPAIQSLGQALANTGSNWRR